MLYPLRALSGFLLLLVAATIGFADIRLPKIFSDKMVLQQGPFVRIWGTAEPNEPLQITVGENSADTVTDNQGKWSVEIVPPAVGGPYQLAVTGAKSSVVFTDVLVGEVWLCAGESNMQKSLEQSLEFSDQQSRDAYFLEIDKPNIRLFHVPANAIDEPVADFTEAVAWQECRGETASGFSATAYFFATALQQSDMLKDVPIGLIDASWGGTPAEAWISRSSLAAVESLTPLLSHWNDHPDKRLPVRPSCLFHGMISPLLTFTIRGVIWYQGESNVGRGHQYRVLLATLIQDWRSAFQQGEIPFYFVQLAPYRYSELDPQALPEVWDAQRSALMIPNTAMAGTSDIGNPQELHPRNKQQVGRRLAILAWSQTYGGEAVSSGPRYKHMEVSEDGGGIRLQFENNQGMKWRGQTATGFLVCGQDRIFHPAAARIEDNSLLVWSADVAQPTHVRYLWEDTAEASLFNEAGLPAIPFRTDDFELLSRDRHF